MKKYKVVRYSLQNELIGEFASWAKAISMLRTLGPGYFVQGPHKAWFFDDVSKANGGEVIR